MSGTRFEFEAETFRWESRRDLWVFARVPVSVAQELEQLPHPPAGWDSIKVTAQVGGTRWRTSVFPQRDGSYVLPLKAAIRRAERIELGDPVRVALEVD